MNKQIEEIKKLTETLRLIDELQYDHNYTLSYQRAICLNKAGYRKSTDVAREIFDAIEEILHKYSRWDMLAYGKHYYTDDDGEIGKGLAELRRKYESEGADDEG